MTKSKGTVPRILELARRIEQDIAERKLKPGDRYLNAGDVAAMLRVSKQSANRAMQLLTQRRVLQRKQRRGTYVADPRNAKSNALISTVFLWVQHFAPSVERWGYEEVILGLNRIWPGVHVQILFLPNRDEREFCQQAIRRCLAMEHSVGLILNRTSLAAQRIVQDSGLPAVVHGTPQPSVTRMPSLDRDQFAMGKLLADRVLRQHKRLLVLMREWMLSGDHLFLDGVASSCTQAGLPADALMIRDLPMDAEAIRAEVITQMTGRGPRRGIIARSEHLVHGALLALEQLKLTPGKQVLTVLADDCIDSRSFSENMPQLPFIRVKQDAHLQGEMLGRLLREVAENPQGKPQHIRLPVELVEPPKHV